ncbi:MAG: PHP domain-containing protein [Clostridia bacterium]|nr:PHP domain-containing protein [Clostridia bacterium]
MNRYYYDLHIHSCLSPCGDDESTPDSIAGMGELNGLDVMALTDHNTTKNCPAFFAAAKRHNIIPVAGMELTTAEEIHIVCLFPTLDSALSFDSFVDSRRIKIQNRTDIFGNQYIMDENDKIIGTDDNLLSNATTISLDEVPDAVKNHGGICYPAHVDREANGIISVLGFFPKTPVFPTIEVHDENKREDLALLCKKDIKKVVTSSDAHYLWDINEKTQFFDLDCKKEDVARCLIEYLGGVSG